MLKLRTVLVGAMVWATPAGGHVWPCPHGQFYRPGLHTCVPLGSPLARAWAYAPERHPRRQRLEVGGLVTPPTAAPTRSVMAVPSAPFALPGLSWDDGGAADDVTRGRLLLRVALSR